MPQLRPTYTFSAKSAAGLLDVQKLSGPLDKLKSCHNQALFGHINPFIGAAHIAVQLSGV